MRIGQFKCDQRHSSCFEYLDRWKKREHEGTRYFWDKNIAFVWA